MKKVKKKVAPTASPMVPESRNERDRLTRTIAPVIKGQKTNATQWDRWTPWSVRKSLKSQYLSLCRLKTLDLGFVSYFKTQMKAQASPYTGSQEKASQESI